jgi:hypothetical protein
MENNPRVRILDAMDIIRDIEMLDAQEELQQNEVMAELMVLGMYISSRGGRKTSHPETVFSGFPELEAAIKGYIKDKGVTTGYELVKGLETVAFGIWNERRASDEPS